MGAKKKYLDEPVEVFCLVEAKTDMAILVSDGTVQAWVPLSQVREMEERDGGVVITIPEWLAIDKGFV